jgi:hypothetical protein
MPGITSLVSKNDWRSYRRLATNFDLLQKLIDVEFDRTVWLPSQMKLIFRFVTTLHSFACRGGLLNNDKLSLSQPTEPHKKCALKTCGTVFFE